MKILRLLVLFFILCYTLPAHAETQEWKDKNYPFSSQKRIYVVYSTPNNINEISEHEISDMMYDKLMPMAKSLNQLGYSVFNQADIVENLKREKNIDLPELYKTIPILSLVLMCYTTIQEQSIRKGIITSLQTITLEQLLHIMFRGEMCQLLTPASNLMFKIQKLAKMYG